MYKIPKPTPDQNHSVRPRTREAARLSGNRLYDTGEKCPECAHIETGCSMRFTATGTCVQCCREETRKVWTEDWEAPKTREEAIQRGLDWYLTDLMCERAGHIGVKTLDGECAICARDKVKKRDPARAEARTSGAIWYQPSEPCPECGHTAPRRVSTNSCRQCEINAKGSTDGRETASSRLMRESPAMVLDRAAARALGFKVYRTGKACKKGHEGGRSVPNGASRVCKR